MVPDKIYQALAALGMESAEEGPSLGPDEVEMVVQQFEARIARRPMPGNRSATATGTARFASSSNGANK